MSLRRRSIPRSCKSTYKICSNNDSSNEVLSSHHISTVISPCPPAKRLSVKVLSINELPLEILYLIMERMENDTFVKSFFVCKLWRSAIIRVANADKTNRRWKLLYKLFEKQDIFETKSKNLTYEERLANVLRWNLDLVFAPPLKVYTDTCVKKVNVYKDNIIVVDNKGVKYFSAHTQAFIKKVDIINCLDFNECDSLVVTCTEGYFRYTFMRVRLLLLGKTSGDNYLAQISARLTTRRKRPQTGYENIIMTDDIRHHMMEKERCYIVNSRYVFVCYQYIQGSWFARNLGRFYGNEYHGYRAINVFNTKVFMFFEWGQMKYYCYPKRSFQNACYISVPYKKSSSMWIVHKYCLVIGLPEHHDFRITRYINDGYYFYKFECPNLSYVRDHGEMLILGYNDGKVELFMPKALTRDKMLRGWLNLRDYVTETDSEHLAVISIDVCEDRGKHHLIVATASCVYQFVITHPNGDHLWYLNPEIKVFYRYPVIENGLQPP